LEIIGKLTTKLSITGYVISMKSEIQTLLNKVSEEDRSILTYEESREVMKLAGFPLNKMLLAMDVDECLLRANEIEYPIVLKVVSEDVVHKSDSGGVKVGISSDEELRKAYDEMMVSVKNYYPKAIIQGFSVEQMVSGVELLVGTSTDSQFGKMIALGIGGIFVEVYKDVSFKLIPITEQDVHDMLEEIQGRKMLEGYRGMPKVDVKELTSLMLKVSSLIDKFPQIQEMDLNPIVATSDGLKAIDARIILE
jgi:acyl-CoA synthetase (NDP forming)